MRNIITTCYLDYVNLGYFNPTKFTNPSAINAKDYNDPDACCEELYDDLLELYKDNFKKLGFTLSKNTDEYLLWMDKDNIGYTISSDYIGPSRAGARNAGLPSNEVGEYLRKTRVIGGHMLWPVQYREDYRNTIILTGKGGTINIQRGGEKGFCDRIDCTLQDLQNFYAYIDGNSEVNYKLSVFEKYKKWIMLFSNFESFVNFFYLNDFCDSDYRVYDLSSYNKADNKYEAFIGDEYTNIDYYKIGDAGRYRAFIDGSICAILSRQLRIKKALEK